MKKIFSILLSFCLCSHVGMAFEPKNYQASWNQLLFHPKELQSFLDGMPIGADLHCHASGAASTESLVKIAQEHHYCMDTNYKLIEPVNGVCVNGHWTDKLLNQPYYRQKTIEAWSMQNFHASAKEDNKTHFFKTFEKFSYLPKENWPQVIADVVNIAHQEHVQYLELMLSMRGKKPHVTLSPQQYHIADVLKHPEFKNYIHDNIQYYSQLKQEVKKNSPYLGQDVDVAWILEIKRNQPFEKFWVDAVMAFAITNKVPDIVAVNLVQPEYAEYANNDYLTQMKFLQILKLYYPKVKLVIHAGEIPEKTAIQSDIDHIRLALDYLQPARIGHGTMINYEKYSAKTLDFMRDNNIPVEINLTSNDQILDVKGQQHPLRTYLKAGIPIVISSDDPGVSRNRISFEYMRAIQEHGLSLDEVIQANRNSLTYSLLPGNSLWQDNLKAIPVKSCQLMKSKQCIDFISKNPKAYQQWVLEDDLELYFVGHLKN